MRVAIIHYWLVGMRGGEKVLEALCRLYPQADVYTHCVRPEALSPLLAELWQQGRLRTSFIQRLPAATRLYKHYLPLMPLALEQLDLRGYDLILSSESGPAKGVIAPARVPHVCYCHSPMRYLWDMYHDYLENAGWLSRNCMRLMFHYLRQWDTLSAGRVDRVVANSAAVARRVARWWGREAVVVHPPVAVEAFAETFAARVAAPPSLSASENGYYLCFGELVGYKRVDVAIRACALTGKRLVVAGDGPERQRLQALAGPGVAFEGRVTETRLRELYAGCRALLFPGEEDFGIVPVEAMASGCPVLAFGRGGALETVKDGQTGRLFMEQTPEALAQSLQSFERDGQTLDPQTLRTHAAQFAEEPFRSGFTAEVDKALAGDRGSRV